MYLKSLLSFSVLAMMAMPGLAQNQDKQAAAGEGGDTNLGKARNMMMNAGDESEPRSINIGIPDLPNAGVVAENGMVVSGDNYILKNNQAWRQDGSFKKPTSLSFAETAMKYGASVVAMSTETRQGTDKFMARMNFGTNSFGKMNGNLSLAGPIKKGWYYHVNLFGNFDPETTRSQAIRYKDQTIDAKGLLTKKWKTGEFNFQYKMVNSHKINDLFCPYIFNSDEKQVTQLNNFEIAKDSYLQKSSKYYWQNPKTGNYEWVDIMDDICKSNVHAFDLFGKHDLKNKMKIDWGARYQHGVSGFANLALNKTVNVSTLPATTKFYYANTFENSNNVVTNADGKTEYRQQYTGNNVQNLMCGLTAPTTTHMFTHRFDIGRKGKVFSWNAGLNGTIYNIVDFTQSSYNSFLTVEPNPSQLIRVNKSNAVHNEYGGTQYNNQILYLAGTETKEALYGMFQVKPFKGFKIDGGVRLEYYNQNFDYSPASARTVNASYIETDPASPNYNLKHGNETFFNKSFTVDLTYNIQKNWGLTGNVYRLEVANPMNAYKGKEEVGVNGFRGPQTSTVPYYALGVFLNSQYVDFISRVYYISRDNISQQGNFNYTGKDSTDPSHPHSTEAIKMGFDYGVKTTGWTTDAIIKPFKGFQLHLLVTIQNPKYFDFKFTLPETTYKSGNETLVQPAETYDYNGVVARAVSKFLMEIDPSYSYDKFRFWASFRYFSKQSAVMPGTMFFPQRWETFAGIDYQATKKVGFSLNVSNFLNQVGAQGRIIGTNTLQDYEMPDYLGQVVNGTYIRPFTIDLKCKIQF